ncbi:right-handed parallel beta-helix repeat-containing protein [Kitasatospora sp. McL0602]|uniref:right-handed parallel beta-helix repeat-containing protein n=1 Tax=Kitasatospora sp. McL0602 TaxID=3439530 RepID=UPI003F8BCD29
MRTTPHPGRAAVTALAVTVAALAGAAPAHAVGTTYFVGGAGCSDSGPGSGSQPFCTISKGASVATAGATVLVASGTYAEKVTVPNSGAPGAPVTIKAATAGGPVVTGGASGFVVTGRSYVTIDGFTVTRTTGTGIALSSSDHLTVSHNTVSYAGQPVSGQNAIGVDLTNVRDSLLLGNVSDHNSFHGFRLGGGSTGDTVQSNEASYNAEGWQRNANGLDVVSPGNLVEDNVFHDNEDSGLQYYSGGDNNVAVDNVLYDNGDHGIDNNGVSGGVLVGNTVHGNCTDGINVEGSSSNFTVENNIATDNAINTACAHGPAGRDGAGRAGEIGIYDTATSGTTVDWNLTHSSVAGAKLYQWGGTGYSTLSGFQATGQGAHELLADPKYAAAASGDLRLTTGSPAIDSANSGAPDEPSTDANGATRADDPATVNTGAGSRAYDDRGAYEFAGQAGPPPSVPTAALSLTPGSGTAPVTVTADASASTDIGSTISGYTFTFGDGTGSTTQSTPQLTHSYPAAGTYTVTLTVTDATGATATTTGSVTVSAPSGGGSGTGPAYVGRVGGATGTAGATTLTLHPGTAGVKAGDALVVSAMLTNTKAGTVSASDTQGNHYGLTVNQSDGAGDATVLLVATGVKALSATDTITLTFPATTEQHLAVDEYAGVTAVDQHASAAGTAAAFSSGATATTTAATELLVGAAGVQGGSNVTWSAGFTPLPELFVSSDQLATAYQPVTATGAYSATGTADRQWMAGVVTLK